MFPWQPFFLNAGSACVIHAPWAIMKYQGGSDVPSNQNEPHERDSFQGHRRVARGLQRKYFPVSDIIRTVAHWLMWTLLWLKHTVTEGLCHTQPGHIYSGHVNRSVEFTVAHWTQKHGEYETSYQHKFAIFAFMKQHTVKYWSASSSQFLFTKSDWIELPFEGVSLPKHFYSG